MKTAIFLGAGASKAEGIPVQDELLKLYFENISGSAFEDAGSEYDMNKTLLKFFRGMFNLDVANENVIKKDFPSFEEIMGVLELAEIRRETLQLDKLGVSADKDLHRKNNQNPLVSSFLYNNLQNHLVRLYMIVLISKVLGQHSNAYHGYHSKLICNLNRKNLLKDTIIITTNYDTLIDNAIIKIFGENHIDYGIEFYANRTLYSPISMLDSYIKLFKIHGSLNWLYCPTCNNLKLTPVGRHGIELVTDFTKSRCGCCECIMLPVIVPPTYFKDMSNIFLATIWNKTENILKEVDNIIFCGYSFCESDIHIKYLIKRVQLSKLHKLNFTVINNYDGKTRESMEEEAIRYKRFLGSSVNYTENSFIDFAEKPWEFFS